MSIPYGVGCSRCHPRPQWSGSSSASPERRAMTRCWKGSDRALMRARLGAFAATVVLLLTPSSVAAQRKVPEKPEVVKLTLKGVHVVKKDELMQSIATDQSHCNSVILKPVCWISKSKYVYTKNYLDHEELKRDLLRIQVFYWKRGYRDAEVDTDAEQVALQLFVNEVVLRVDVLR